MLAHAMYERDLERERAILENALEVREHDFAGAYLAICDLHSLVKTHPRLTHPGTVSALEGVLRNSNFSSQSQSFFLYRKAADALVSVVVGTIGKPLADHALSTLQNLLGTTNGHSCRASTEALGSLPLSIHGPTTSEQIVGDFPQVRWPDILKAAGLTTRNVPAVFGRSFVVATDKKDMLLVVKLASGEDAAQSVYKDAVWMEHLSAEGYCFPVRFNIPTPIKFQGSYVFRLENMPVEMPEERGLEPSCYGISFFAHEDYFAYPNDYRPGRRFTMASFREVMFRNAWLLGRLTSLGIVHCAPIPLFHNRVQRNRRADRGLYEWQRGGRLDRWLDSCRYPNFGLTGIRDFEHFTSFNGSGRELYHHIGSQILSLLLTTGSYFRSKNIQRVGFDAQGKAVDARDLFDKPFFQELVQGIFLGYYKGFTGREFKEEIPCDFDGLTSRMIETMGVDRHMEEVLRVADQMEMSDESFKVFLKSRGYSEDDTKVLKKGVEDVTVYTGPHLGGFNERISIPELTESVGAMSALCIAGRYRIQTPPRCYH
jgi:hypothetical protein